MAKFWFNCLFTVIGWAASVVTIWGGEQPSGVRWPIFIIIAFAAVYIYVQWADYRRERKRVQKHSSSKAVHAYLYDWIKNGGRTVVFTRDFTWADCNEKMLALLKEKAKNRELIVCLCRATDITDQLKELGAEIYIHDIRELKSRFTIIHYGTNYPKVTVGSKDADGRFINEQYNMKDNPNVYNTFVELFESAKAAAKSA